MLLVTKIGKIPKTTTLIKLKHKHGQFNTDLLFTYFFIFNYNYHKFLKHLEVFISFAVPY